MRISILSLTPRESLAACLPILLFGMLGAAAASAEVESETKFVPAAAGVEDRVGRSVSLSGDGRTALLGAPAGFIGSSGPGAAYVFVLEAGGWVEQAQLVPGDSSPNDQFGETVALSDGGNTAVVGSWNDTGSPSGAYVYTRTAGAWSAGELLAVSDGALVQQGWSVAVSGDGGTLLLGSHETGAAYVFARDGGTWVEETKLVPSDPSISGDFGRRVAVDADGDAAAVTSFDGEAVYLFKRLPSGWVQRARLSDTELGSAVAISHDGHTVVAGASFSWSGSGYASVFVREAGEWIETARLAPSVPETGDWFASAVAISGDGSRVAVGSNFSDSGVEPDAGAVYLFDRTGGDWTEVYRVLASDATFNDEFGNAVALDEDGETLLVGAHNKDFFVPPTYRGAGYVYRMPPRVGGSVDGLDALRVRCTNLSTGQSVMISPAAGSWSCEAEGLAVTPGDGVRINVRGDVP